MFVKNYDEIENIIKKEHIDIVICAADTRREKTEYVWQAAGRGHTAF
jgi:hypothetical protein